MILRYRPSIHTEPSSCLPADSHAIRVLHRRLYIKNQTQLPTYCIQDSLKQKAVRDNQRAEAKKGKISDMYIEQGIGDLRSRREQGIK